MDDPSATLASDPRYAALVRARSCWAWGLTSFVVVLYAAFILLVAIDKPMLARPVLGTISLGIPVGFAMIVIAVASIAVFSLLSNRRFDPRMAELLAEHGA